MDLLRDIRFATRSFIKTPGVTIAAVLSIALGIAATTSVFTLVNAVLFKPMPVRDAQQLVALYTTKPDERFPSGFSFPDYRDYRDGAGVFSDLYAYNGESVAFSSGREKSELIWGELVTGNYFTGLGVAPAAGRVLTTDDDRVEGAHPVAVLSHAFWQRRFGSHPGVVGTIVKLNGREFTVVGVARKGFSGTRLVGFIPDVWMPLSMHAQIEPQPLEDRGARWFNVNGRLKPGVSLDRATAAVNVIADRLAREYPTSNARVRAGMVPAPNKTEPAITQLGYIPIAAQTMMALVVLVLLIACANVANLLLARASTRRREIAMRLACGAPRTRLVGQLLTESIILAVSGGAAGFVLARWFMALVPTFNPTLDFATIDFDYDFGLDYRVLLFTTGTTVLTGIVFGLLPSLQASKVDLVSVLQRRDGSDGRPGGRGGLRHSLVVAQVALSLSLVIGAGAFVRSMQSAQHIDPGFETKNILLVSVDVRRGYDPAKGRAYLRSVLDRIRALPGVTAASMGGPLPLDAYGTADVVIADGYVPRDPNERIEVKYSIVGDDYFRAMSTAVVAGRTFAETDTATTTPVVVINETMARRFWPDETAIGKRIRLGSPTSPAIEVVGVARDGKYNLLGEPPTEYFFLPHAQRYNGQMTLITRTSGSPAALAAAVQREIAGLDPDVPIYGVKTMPMFLDRLLSLPKSVAVLGALFAFVALLMASVGLYGVMSYSIARRTKEIGLRIAVGATRGDVMRMVLAQGMTLAVVGVAIGTLGALALLRMASSLLYGVGADDPPMFLAGATVLTAVALTASYVPARRAMRLDPSVALRDQ
jgi:putative ABC transport system permease protein